MSKRRASGQVVAESAAKKQKATPRTTRGSRARAEQLIKQQVAGRSSDSGEEEEEDVVGTRKSRPPPRPSVGTQSTQGAVVQPANSFLSDSSSAEEEEEDKPSKASPPSPRWDESSSSESTGSSEFFKQPGKRRKPVAKSEDSFEAIEKNILAGVSRLTDSEDSDDAMNDVEPTFVPTHVLFPQLVKAEEGVGTNQAGHQAQVEKNLENDKGEDDIAKLLAMGESQPTPEEDKTKSGPSKSSRNNKTVAKDDKPLDKPDKSKRSSTKLSVKKPTSKNEVGAKVPSSKAIKQEARTDSEGSDWEEVAHVEHQHSAIPKEGVEVTLQLPDIIKKRKKKGFDVAAAIQRRMNLMRRERQVLLHQVSLLGWLGHGLHVNSVLDSPTLMAHALSLIPSQHSYPPAKLDLKYLEKVTVWFKKTVGLTGTPEPESLTLAAMLEEGFRTKQVASKRLLVLLYVCMMRSLGVKTRLIMSLQPLPLKPEPLDFGKLAAKSGKAKSTKQTKAEENSKASTSKANTPSTSKADTSTSKIEKLKSDAKNKKTSAIPKNNKSPYFSEKSEYFDKNSKLASQSVKKTVNDTKSKKNNSTTPVNDAKNNLTASKGESAEKRANASSPSTSPQKSSIPVKETSRRSSSRSKPSTSNSSQKRPLTKSAPKSQDSPSRRESSANAQSKARPAPRAAKGVSAATSGSAAPRTLRERRPSKYKDESSEESASESSKSQTKRSSKPTPPAKSKQSVSKAKKEEDCDSSDDFKPQVLAVRPSPGTRGGVDRRVLSSEEESQEAQKSKVSKPGLDVWAEVFVEMEEKWISVDVTSGKVHCVSELTRAATSPVKYVVGLGGAQLGCVRDVTRRYCPQFHSAAARKMRVDDWWEDTLKPYRGRLSAHDREEQEDLERQMQDRPLPATVSEYKSHPLYALKRHLLKFEAIYPPTAAPLGFVRGEEVYSRDCVFTLRSRETWIKEAKVVRPAEQPYKIVKARPKYDRMSGQMVTDKPLEIFGPWQVDDYVPPAAKDGKVPRNEYGNVELFKPTMLPAGTVHLQIACLNRVAKKLAIDCAPAMVGFDYHCGGCHPVFDGFVVCEEFKDVLLDAHRQEEEERERRHEEKRLKRVLGNWRRLVNGLLIREKLQRKYSFSQPGPSAKGPPATKGKGKKAPQTKRPASSSDSD